MSIEKITPQIAALYLGQKCTVYWPSRFTEETNISHKCLAWLDEDGTKVTPHLRSPNTLTEQECQMLYKIETGKNWIEDHVSEENAPSCIRFWFQDEYKGPTGSPLVWLKMLEIGFDLFGLIPAGLAKEIGDGK